MHRANPRNTSLEPNWGPMDRRALAVSRGLFHWLQERGSLTRRVMGVCPGRFRVRLLHQGWGRPLYSEGRLLRMRRGEVALVREVELLCDETPWVFARTLIPAGSLRGAARRLARLGERPLGAVLFSDPNTRRELVQAVRLSPRHPLHAAASHNLDHPAGLLWGRRSLYYYAGKPLLVNEIFLPDIPLQEAKA